MVNRFTNSFISILTIMIGIGSKVQIGLMVIITTTIRELAANKQQQQQNNHLALVVEHILYNFTNRD